MEAGGRQEPIGALGRVAQVQPIDAWARAIQAGVAVVGRGAALGGGRNPADLHRRLGQGSEVFRQARLHGRDLFVEVGDQPGLAGIRVRIDSPLGLIEPVIALADRALGHAQLAEQHIRPGRELAGDVQAQLVDLGGAQRRGRRGGQRMGVIGLALRQPPDAGVVHRPASKLAQQRHLAIQRRHNLGRVGRARPRRPVPRDPLGRGALNQRSHQRRGLSRRPQQLHAGQGAIDGEVGRDDPQADVAAHPLQLLVHHPAKRLQARYIGLGVLAGLDAVLAGQEVGRVLPGAVDLAQHIGRARALAAIDKPRVRLRRGG